MKSVRIFMLALMLTMLTVSAAFAQTVQVVNGTGFTIAALGLAHESADDIEDLLGDGVLEHEYALPIEIEGATSGWILVAADPEGNTIYWEGLDLAGVSAVIIYADGTAEFQ